MRGEELHDQDGDDDQHVDEIPRHHHGFVEVLVKAGFGADAFSGAVAEEVCIQFSERQLGQEEDHQAKGQDAEPQRTAPVGGSGIRCRPQDGDEACHYGCHCLPWT